jgi:glycosyltransferase involved in cell wall biosynthesis
MIKVCMVVHKYYPRDMRVRRYAESLTASGVEVDVLCVSDNDQPSTNAHNGVRVYTLPFSRNYKNRSYLVEYGMSFPLYASWLLRLHMRNRYQIIHVHNMPDFLAFAALIPKLLGAKLILDIHDPMPEFYMSKYEAQADRHTVKLMRLQEKLSAKVVDALITANQNFKENLIKRGVPADKITVINNIPDPRIFKRKAYAQQSVEQREHFTLIYPGTIASRYGLDITIRALPLLLSHIPQLRLVIVGPQEDHVQELAALVEQLGVSAYVEFKPAIPLDEVPRQIAQADIGIYPARPDAHMSIATPTKVLEYAFMGIPIVASRLKILEDLFTDSSIMFFEPGNAEQFARCVIELYDNPTCRHELVKNMDHIFVSSHSWYNECNIYFSLVNRLLVTKEKVQLFNPLVLQDD